MPFEKGHPKYGGVTKGTKHKKTLLREALEENDFDPIVELMLLFKKPFHKNNDGLIEGLSDRDKSEALLELLEYLFPKQKDLNLQEDAARSDEEIKAKSQAILEQLRKNGVI